MFLKKITAIKNVGRSGLEHDTTVPGGRSRPILNIITSEGGDDPAYIIHALGTVARTQNISQLARDTGMSREGIYKALSEDGNPSFATVTKIALALGLRIAIAPERTAA